MPVEILNLDKKCFETGIKIVDELNIKKEKIENLIQKSLGVLQENGVFAFYIFLESQSGDEKTIANKILTMLLNLSKEICFSSQEPPSSEILKQITEDLDKLILVKELFERVLVYSRFHAKNK